MPLDPFDGKPLKFARRADGVTVYAIGTDGQDDGGAIPAKPDGRKGQDVGIRLFDPASRGLPPPPSAPPDGPPGGAP